MGATAIIDIASDSSVLTPTHPTPGSRQELCGFAALQRRLKPMFTRVFSDPLAARTVVVIPSMSLDHEELAKLDGASWYEERFLCLLMLLRLPATHVVYLTSQPVAESIVDYYLRFIRDVQDRDARSRLTMLTCDDASPVPLTEKILARPALVSAIRAEIDDPDAAHITCFAATPLERTLALRLGIPLYGCDPALGILGSKSGSREVFREADVSLPPGFEHLRGEDDLVAALVELKRQHAGVQRAVIKLEEGFSGEGNATFSYDGAPEGPDLIDWVRSVLPRRARLVAPNATWESYREQFARMGGIVEAFVSGAEVRSPSVQCRIDPSGATQIISTHDQVLGGATGQIYLGCTFPAEPSCCPGLHEAARRITAVLARRGVVGRFGIDFVSTRVRDEWIHHAIEINIRKGGTTHPYLTLQLLTDGAYETTSGLFRSATGRPCFYVASDNVRKPSYTWLSPESVVAAVERDGLAFDSATETGVVLHMLGALSEFGKLGVVCIAPTRARASELFAAVGESMDREADRTVCRRERVAVRSRPRCMPHNTL